MRLGLASAAAVRRAARDLLALADGAAVLVQPQRRGVELVLGGIRDPEFGPVLLAGLGGVLVEAVRDVRLAVAPVDEAAAVAMLRSLRGAAVLDGLRGGPAVDLRDGGWRDREAGPAALRSCRRSASSTSTRCWPPGTSCVAVDWRIPVG